MLMLSGGGWLMELLRSSAFDELGPLPDVSIVMPCLNEAQALPHCIDNACAALREIQRRYGLSGEIVIADNGSTDGSQQLALNRGARVIAVSRKGYGAAIIGGFEAARGRFLVMGDADGSYVVKKIESTPTDANDRPRTPVRMNKVTIIEG